MDPKKLTLVAAMFLATCGLVGAQQTVTKPGPTVKASATITKIDPATRMITFKMEDGTEDTALAGPEIKRFDELKVGDKINMTYYSALVFQIRKPGDPPLTAATKSMAQPAGGKLPGGTYAEQVMRTVTVKAVDANVGSITVVTSEGRTLTRTVENKANLKGVKVGDQIDITYTEAMLVGVERK
jgi:Cu/Ag efflux protein CusF